MSSRARVILVALAFLAFVSLGLPDTLLGVAWPSVRAAFGLPLSQLGTLLLCSTSGYLLASFTSGAIVARLGVGRLLVASSLAVAISLFGFAAAPGWWAMLAFGVLAGLGAGAIDAAVNAFAAHEFSPRVLNWLHACWGIGASLGPLVMTVAIAAGAGWRWGYAAVGFALAGMTACFIATVRLWDTGGHHSSPDAARDGSRSASVPITFALRRPMVWMNVALFFVYTGVAASAGSWAYTLLTESRGVPRTVAGTCVAAYWASLTAGRIAFGQASSRVAPVVLLRLATAVAPVAALMIWLNPLGRGDVAGLVLLGFVLAPVYPLLMSQTPARLGRDVAAHAIGFQVSSACLGVSVLPGLAGVLARHLGIPVVAPFIVVGALALLVLHEIALGHETTTPPRRGAGYAISTGGGT